MYDEALKNRVFAFVEKYGTPVSFIAQKCGFSYCLLFNWLRYNQLMSKKSQDKVRAFLVERGY